MKNWGLFIIFFIIGVAGGVGFKLWRNNKPTNTIKSVAKQQEPQLDLKQAPKESIRGVIESMTGEIKWQSRIATEASNLTKPVPIQQGETLQSEDDGKISIAYENSGSFTLSPNSKIEIIQTLPVNFVFDQKKGTITYEGNQKTPFSIRSFHLITKINEGTIEINVDDIKHIIEINVINGSATLGYNNLDYESKVIMLEKDQKFIFDDDNRVGEIE